jgi:toxin FitB
MIVVDTNVISEAMRDTANGRVVEWMDAQAVETLFLSQSQWPSCASA